MAVKPRMLRAVLASAVLVASTAAAAALASEIKAVAITDGETKF